MRILCITATYTPSINGVAISIRLLKQEIEKLGHEFVIITPKHDNHLPESNVYRLPSLPNILQKDFPLPLPIIPPNSLKKFKSGFDIVFFHHPFGIAELALYLAKSNHCPSVFFYHSRYDEVLKNHLSSDNLIKTVPKILNSIIQNTINRVNHVIVETQSIKDVLLANKIQVPISVISTARANMTSSHSKLSLRKKYLLPKNKMVFLCVSRLSKEKNLDLLITTFKNTLLKDTTLLMIGDGPESSHLKKISSPNINFLGAIPFEKMSEIYSLADIFVFPSKLETQGIVVLEAMTAGLPILAFNAPGPKDFVVNNKHGLLANTDSEFISNISRLSSQPKLIKKFGQNALSESQKYSLQKTAKTTLKLFSKLITEN